MYSPAIANKPWLVVRSHDGHVVCIPSLADSYPTPDVLSSLPIFAVIKAGEHQWLDPIRVRCGQKWRYSILTITFLVFPV